SLNFHPSEKLNQETLFAISNEYMAMIGFGEQPYLVYEHLDAGHPHIHIVTTNIEATGKRIDTYNIGKLKSEIARKEIEKKFGLVRTADGFRLGSIKIDIRNVEYGKAETKRSITNVLDKVLNFYNYNSLATLNAILKTYNITADRGRKGGRIYNHGGILFHTLDSNGNRIGVPIKASSIYSKPTLVNLEIKFKENHVKRSKPRTKLKGAIDTEILKKPKNLKSMISNLKEKNIDTILRKNDQGFVFGITFVDHTNKSVYNGSEIGKEYSLSNLQKRIGSEIKVKQKGGSLLFQKGQKRKSKVKKTDKNLTKNPEGTALVKNLLKPEEPDIGSFYLLPRKKRKKKRRLNL
ncbi:MAG TPA: relaxase/mobilization nuclease domain-containing protein, partial [Cytophagaceae bacterium]|nr:relaxase/mobilization nuclease domain-containing protein [Cytophagaceae bacterium]